MASRPSEQNLWLRNGTYYRGYYPTELVRAGWPRERQVSLKTSDYGAAVHLRDKERVRHREEIEIALRRHRRDFLVLNDLTDDEVQDLAIEVYRTCRRYGSESLTEHVRKLPDGPSEVKEAERRDHPDDLYPPSVLTPFRELYRMLQIDVRDGTDTTGAIKNYTDQVLEHRMVDLTNAPAARRRLEQRVAQAILQSQKDLIDEVNGRPNVSVNDAFFDKARGQPREAPKVVRKQSTPMDAPWLLDRASEEFLKEIRVRRRDKGYFAVRTTMRLMRSFFGSKADVRKLRRADCRSFREFVMSLPTNYTKGYRGIEPKDIPAIRRSEHDLMSYGNVNKTLDHVSLFMNWLEAEEIVEQVPQLRSLKLKDPVSEKEKRKPFQADHLKLIFGSDRMRAERESQSMFFWCSVVGLYHGLRLDEIVSLDASCVTEIDGHPIIQVKLPNEVRDQTIRGGTKTVPRYLPMHPILVGLGLPEFARSRPLGEMLFAEARRNADGYFSDDMSEDFRTFVHELGVPKGGPTFHSLRHNFRDAMSNADLSDQVAAYLGGWKLRGVMNTTYGSHDLRPIHREGIEKVG